MVRYETETQTCDAVTADLLDEEGQGEGAYTAISRAGLCRLVFLAAETAVRFEREGTGGEAIDWMMAPRKLFGGRAPLEACTDPYEMLKGVIFHRLARGLDGDPGSMDKLLSGAGMKKTKALPSASSRLDFNTKDPQRFLYTALCRFERGETSVGLLYVTQAEAPAEVIRELENLLGPGTLRHTVMCRGFLALASQARLIVPPKIFDLLVEMDTAGIGVGHFTLMIERELGH